MNIGRTWYYIFMVLLSVHLSLQDDINKKILKILSDLDTKLIALNDKIDKQDKLLNDKLNNTIKQVMDRFDDRDNQDELLKQAICKLWCTNDQCTSSNNCFCNVDWNENEDKWDITVCEHGCVNGLCTSFNTCTCDPGWTGDHCELPICNKSCINGKCSHPNHCTCDQGWKDEQCDSAVCENGCIHGTCSAPNSCTCDLGWTGDQCDTENCPEADGFFTTSASDQCFKAFRDKQRTWTDADHFCHSQGMQLARPYDDNAAEIQKYLNEKYDDAGYYLGCHGTGSVFKWLRDWQELPADSPLWWPGNPRGFTSDKCLFLTAYDSSFNNHPGKPYLDTYCSSSYYPLCERRIMGQL